MLLCVEGLRVRRAPRGSPGGTLLEDRTEPVAISALRRGVARPPTEAAPRAGRRKCSRPVWVALSAPPRWAPGRALEGGPGRPGRLGRCGSGGRPEPRARSRWDRPARAGAPPSEPAQTRWGWSRRPAGRVHRPSGVARRLAPPASSCGRRLGPGGAPGPTGNASGRGPRQAAPKGRRRGVTGALHCPCGPQAWWPQVTHGAPGPPGSASGRGPRRSARANGAPGPAGNASGRGPRRAAPGGRRRMVSSSCASRRASCSGRRKSQRRRRGSPNTAAARGRPGAHCRTQW